MDTREAAAYAGVAKITMQLYRYEGTGPRYAKIGHRVRYSVEDLDAWLASRTRIITPGDR
jgi:hypothetical protein